jgi:polysaccharide biosynthesis protein PslF
MLGLDGRQRSITLRRPDASPEPTIGALVPGPFPPQPSFSSPEPAALTFGMLGTFPPTACGIATFSAALSAGLIAEGHSVDVVRVTSRPGLDDPLVLASLSGPPGPWGSGIEVLDRTDVAIVQHEYGIYPGPDGDELLDAIDQLKVPTMVVAHTVRQTPTSGQRRVLTELCAAAGAVVVMTRSGRDRLIDGFGVDPSKVHVIAHGAATPHAFTRPPSGRSRPRLLTWGLLGPGKGIEWAIDAVVELGGTEPFPEYLIAGATHPNVKERSGEEYRNMLIQRAWAAGVSPHVSFDDTYHDLPALTELITSADLVVLPYDSEEQVTSGVLVDAVAAGRPVVSTAFPHATELLASGAGIVVPQRDPVALASAIRSVLSDPGLAADMAAEARRLAPGLSWGSVATEYADLAARLFTGQRAGTR